MPRQPGSRHRNFDIEPSENKFGPKAVNPHSPWQLLIEDKREKNKQSMRLLASLAEIPSATLYNWLRSRSGCPSRSIYTDHLNRRLSKALGISEKKLADAYRSSILKPPASPAPPPATMPISATPRPAPHTLQEIPSAFTVDGLKRFLAMLRASGRSTFTIGELELTASMILNSPGN